MMGKTLGDGFGVRGCIRNKDPLLCPQGALGRWLVTRFTLEAEIFPDPTSDKWLDIMLWPGIYADGAMSYQNHLKRVNELYDKLNIAIIKKTHAPRVFAARIADAAGLPDEVSAVNVYCT